MLYNSPFQYIRYIFFIVPILFIVNGVLMLVKPDIYKVLIKQNEGTSEVGLKKSLLTLIGIVSIILGLLFLVFFYALTSSMMAVEDSFGY